MNNSEHPNNRLTSQDVPLLAFVGSIEKLVEENHAIGVEVRFKVHGESRRLPAQTELVLIRAVAEGLNNVRQHADASRVLLDLEFLPANVRMLLQDNGRGAVNPDAAPDAAGSGLLDLRDQVQLLGGQMLIDTELGEGFNLVIEVPG
jgi:signal transduction histidine kinase